MENRLQVENRFPSVVIFITIHQPKSFFSPELWTRTKACLLPLDETLFSGTILTFVAVKCTSMALHLYMGLYRYSKQFQDKY